MNRLDELQLLGQSVWIDYLRRDLITSGRLQQFVDMGVRGMTSNPSIFEKAIAQSHEYDESIREALAQNPKADATALYERLAIEDIQMVADVFRPVYERTNGVDGVISLEASPYLAYDTARTIAEIVRLHKLVNRPNAMFKVPATAEGIPAVEALIAEGININITLMFSMKDYEAVSRAYLNGIATCLEPGRITSVASFFVSRVDTMVDKQLEKIGTPEALALRGKAAVANSKIVYRRFREVFSGQEFAGLRKRGARRQRLLWGSTSTKNSAYPDVLYVDNLIGPDTVNTMPLATIHAFLDHGKAEMTLGKGLRQAERTLNLLASVGVGDDDNFSSLSHLFNSSLLSFRPFLYGSSSSLSILVVSSVVILASSIFRSLR